MASVNRVTLVGNAGRDAELRYLPNGTPVANVTLATSTKRKDRDSGELVEDTQWHRITFYERLAEIAGQYVTKGRPLYVEGRLKYSKYLDKDTGVEKNAVEIVASDMQLLGGREEGGAGQGGDRPAAAPQRQGASAASTAAYAPQGQPRRTPPSPQATNAQRQMRQPVPAADFGPDDDVPF